MYFPHGWPKILDTQSLGDQIIRKICCDRVKILFTVLTDDSISIWFTKPCVPIVSNRRTQKSLEKSGTNVLVEWKPDSNMLVVVTTDGTLLLYSLSVLDSSKGIYNQIDPPFQNLRRDSAELFVKEAIPALMLNLTFEIPLYVPVTCISCISVSQMMVATKSGKVLRIRWDGVEERDFSLDLKRIPFSINQQVSYAVPITEDNTYITSMDYSPLIGGFSITLNDGRAAYLTASNLKFDPNQVQGIWAQNLDDATCGCINHKYRLIAFGRKNAQAAVYTIDDVTGGLEISHKMILSAKDFPGSPGYVREMKWTPDGCAVAVAWSKGGISLWSTFGTMLMCSLGWDYGLHVDLSNKNPFDINCMDWSTEGYQLLMLRQQKIYPKDHSKTPNRSPENDATKHQKPVLTHSYSNASDKSESSSEQYKIKSTLVQLDFVKSSFAVNPCMSSHSHLFLQGDDKLYINQGDSLQKIYHNCIDGNDPSFYSANTQGNMFSQSYNIRTNTYMSGDYVSVANEDPLSSLGDYEVSDSLQVTSMLSESKHWIVLQLPIAYLATNWPIRYSAIDASGMNIAVAGRTGLAMYSMALRKWKLFGNETQEKDFIVTGGILWWDDFVIMGCYSLIQQSDELRLYPKECKLDNRFARVILMGAPVMLINLFKDQLVVFTADGYVTIFAMTKYDAQNVDLVKLHIYDIRGLCIHPACIISVTMTNLKNESGSRASQGNILQPETIVLNVSGRVLMVNREINGNASEQLSSTCLASCVECLWLSNSDKLHLRESLWLYCGGHGMRVWLPVFPREGESGHGSHRHTFMSKRIMLSFTLRVYPLAILFEDAIILGVENDTVLYTSDSSLHFSLPFCFLERTSQVYLHQILRQLIRRNLGYNAWEIARSCTNLPYFPHSLELLLHEVLEEEATSKEPIPDALLPSVLEFIQEFPVYLQTVVQCARKTEIALWPYLFATAGKPKELFQQCLATKQLETAASYLIILQNLEPSSVSRQYATILLETALEQKMWDLAKDLVRFLRAIDPNDVESPRTSFVMGNKLGLTQQASPVSPNAEDISLILGTMTRGRSFSTTTNPKPTDINPSLGSKEKSPGPNVDTSTVVMRRKKSMPNTQREKDSSTAEEFFIEVIIQRHARRLLQEKKLEALGYMSAALDFHLVGWLAREKDRAARIEDFVATLKQLHDDLEWPKPSLELKLNRRGSEKSQQESPSYSVQSLRIEANLGTGDSGYTSLPANSYFENPVPSEQSVNSFFSTPDNPSTEPVFVYNPDLSNLALQNMNLIKFNELCKISEEGDTLPPNAKYTQPSSKLAMKSRTDSYKKEHFVTLNETEAKLPSIDTTSVVSEQTSTSLWGDDNATFLSQDDQQYSRAVETLAIQNTRQLSQKLEVKIRYLLQIFTEANCLDLALLLSILLLDAASVSRITNSAIRSGSLAICRQLRNGLKDITRWSFQECLGYRPFMMVLQQQVNLLDRFVIKQESIPNFVPTSACKQNPIPSTVIANDNLEQYSKNTQVLNSTSAINEPHKIESNKMNEVTGSKLMKSLSDTNILSETKTNSIKPIISSDASSLTEIDEPGETSSGCSIM
ncbi:guanine nucleotide exchange factor subunit Rich [Bradysia coprophila]|uniref:guanine nucleotide exchange factor subunit Rich n=1 Tax=Bradysia coprophila TaxID=38358 RepID=UPI00187DAC7F|nr:guanine nucleotide exchange factor subunit Rich [Bradysia coprophila]